MQTLNKKTLLRISLIAMGCLLQNALSYAPLEAAVQVPEVLTVEEHPNHDVLEENDSSNLTDRNEGERNFLNEKLFQRNPKRKVLSSENGARLHLKSPGKFPGMELGVEMHSLQAFQTIIPPENLPQGFDLKQEQPLLLPPSVNAPDFNGGFLRFTW